EPAGGAHEVGMVEQGRLGPGGPQLLAVEEGDRLDAGTQVLPELLRVRRAGKTEGEADDGNSLKITLKIVRFVALGRCHLPGSLGDELAVFRRAAGRELREARVRVPGDLLEQGLEAAGQALCRRRVEQVGVVLERKPHA